MNAFKLIEARLARGTALDRHQVALFHLRKANRFGPARRAAAQKDVDEAWAQVIASSLKCSEIAHGGAK